MTYRFLLVCDADGCHNALECEPGAKMPKDWITIPSNSKEFLFLSKKHFCPDHAKVYLPAEKDREILP
jgi:hypothetical protein